MYPERLEQPTKINFIKIVIISSLTKKKKMNFFYTVNVDLCEQSQNTYNKIEQYVASTNRPHSFNEK